MATTVKAVPIDLRYSHGSDEMFSLGPLFRDTLFTIGVKHVADEGGAYWLIDAIASHLVTNPRPTKRSAIIFWKLTKNADSSAVLEGFHDAGMPIEGLRQELEYTDFPLDEVTMWSQWDGERWTILMPSEY